RPRPCPAAPPRRSSALALLTLDPDPLPGFLKEAGLDAGSADLDSVASNEKVLDAVQKEVDAANEEMARVEQIKKFKVLATEWEQIGRAHVRTPATSRAR